MQAAPPARPVAFERQALTGIAESTAWTFARPVAALVLLAVPFAVVAPRPATRPPYAFFQLFLRPANAPFPCLLLLGVLDPADELVTGERSDVVPGVERGGIRHQRLP